MGELDILIREALEHLQQLLIY
jgi:hypothetical protein